MGKAIPLQDMSPLSSRFEDNSKDSKLQAGHQDGQVGTGPQTANVTHFQDQKLQLETGLEESFAEATNPNAFNKRKIRFPHVKGKRSQFSDQLVKSATHKVPAAQAYAGIAGQQDKERESLDGESNTNSNPFELVKQNMALR